MKKYLLLLILILCLAFTLTGFGADLFSTYDQRIKFTIDNTKIDAELTWIPITTFFTAAQAEEIFAEFDSDDDFDRGAFTKADESTQLYADCELFDDSESDGIYHVSRDGWVIANGADTDYYFYYDKDAAHNTTYISKSGSTAAQSVWDGNFKAVYHMNDGFFDSWTDQYEAMAEPDDDSWTLFGTDYSTSDGDILTIDTTGGSAYFCYYNKAPDVTFNAGVYVKTRVRMHTDTPVSGYFNVNIQDSGVDRRTGLRIYDGKIAVRTSVGNYNDTIMDTTSAYHVYSIYTLDAVVLVYVDGILTDTQGTDYDPIINRIGFGDYSSNANENIECMIDYFYYALGVADNPIITIFDSTSNNNNGTKKGANKPAEATGKVGQGQDFDGSDDVIYLADIDAATFEFVNSFTVEICAKLDSIAQYEVYVSNCTSAGYGWRIWTTDGADHKVHWSVSDAGWADVVSTTLISTSAFQYLAGVHDGTYVKLYVDGVAEGGNVETGNIDYAANSTRAVLAAMPSDTGATTFQRFIEGDEDEVRISNTPRAAAWIKATYNSLWDTFLTYGAEETSGVEEANAIFFGMNF